MVEAEDAPGRMVRTVLRRIVEPPGLAVLEAEHGRQGLDRVKTHPVDAMTLEWNMPALVTTLLIPGRATSVMLHHGTGGSARRAGWV